MQAMEGTFPDAIPVDTRVRSRSRSLSRPSARHAVAVRMRLAAVGIYPVDTRGTAPSSSWQGGAHGCWLVEGQRSRSPIKLAIHLKVCAVDRATPITTKKMSYWAFEFMKFLDKILSFCDPDPTVQYNQIACCNRASNIAWRRMYTPKVRDKFTRLIKFFKGYGTRYGSHPEYNPEIEGDAQMWAIETADMIGLHPAFEIWDQA